MRYRITRLSRLRKNQLEVSCCTAPARRVRPKGILRPLPEGAIGEAASMEAALVSGLWSLDDQSVYLSPAPLYHSAPIGFSSSVQRLGGTVIMMRRFDEEAALQAIEKYGVTSQPVGADDVHTHAEAAIRNPHAIRPLVAQNRNSRRGSVSRLRSRSACSIGGVRSSTSTTAAPN